MRIALGQLQKYIAKYEKRLSIANLTNCRALVEVLQRLAAYNSAKSERTAAADEASAERTESAKRKSTDSTDTSTTAGANGESVVHQLTEFVLACGIDNFDLNSLQRFIRESKLSIKLRGFVDKQRAAEVQLHAPVAKRRRGGQVSYSSDEALHSNAMFTVSNFISILSGSDADGRIICRPNCYKYVLLNPSAKLKPLLAKARSGEPMTRQTLTCASLAM